MDGLVPFYGGIGYRLQPPCSLCLGYRFGDFNAHYASWAFSLQAQFLRLQITSLNLIGPTVTDFLRMLWPVRGGCCVQASWLLCLVI